jgi:hypothetical protein
MFGAMKADFMEEVRRFAARSERAPAQLTCNCAADLQLPWLL